MSPEANKRLLRADVETIFNHQQLERVHQFLTADSLDHVALPGQASGLEGAKHKWAMFLAGLPDLCVTIGEVFADADKVAVRRSYAGTHQGVLLGIAPTGKQVRIGGISIIRLADGKLAEQWEQLDRLALLQQLGQLPHATHVGAAGSSHIRPAARLATSRNSDAGRGEGCPA